MRLLFYTVYKTLQEYQWGIVLWFNLEQGL